MRKIIFLIIYLIAGFTVRADELEMLLKSVVENNLELKAMRQQIKAEGYDLKSQNTLDATSIEYSPFFLKGADGVASSELIVTQEFDFPTLYSARGKSAKMQVAVLERNYEQKCRDLLFEATGAYLQLVKLGKENKFIVDRLNNARKVSELYAKRAQAGDATSIELNRVKIQIMEIEAALIENEKAMSELQAQINAFNGYREYDCSSLDYPGWNRSGDETGPVDTDAEVKAAQSLVESYRQEERVANQDWLPKMTLGYRRNTELEQASNGFVVGASFNLFSTSGKVKAAKARKAAAEVEVDNARRKVENEIATAQKQLSFIEKSMKVYDLSLIEESTRLINRSLELGQMNLTDYYIELGDLNEKREAFITLEYEYYQSLCVLYKNTFIQNVK